MMKYILFEKALGLSEPWHIKSMDFLVEKKQLNIEIDFKKGISFHYDDGVISGDFKAYDTVEKTYRHLIFLSMNVFYMHAFLMWILEILNQD